MADRLITPATVRAADEQSIVHQAVGILAGLPDVYSGLAEAKATGTPTTVLVKQGLVRDDGGTPLVIEVAITIRTEEPGEVWS